MSQADATPDAGAGAMQTRDHRVGRAGVTRGSDEVGPASDERVLLSIRPHPVTIFLRSFVAILILVVYAAFLHALTVRASGPRGAAMILWLAFGVVAARVAIEIARWLGRRYVLTDRRLWAWDGVFRRWRVEITLDRVQNIVLHRTLVERLLGLGTIGVSSAAGGGGLDVLWISIAGADSALRTISDARDAAMGAASGRARPAPTPARDAPGRPALDPAPSGPPVGRTPRPLVIGLVGGVGSGKSAAAVALAETGALVSDSDAQAKAMLERPAIRDMLASWWGDRVLTPAGTIDRKAVAAIVFNDARQRRRLEALIHPLLREGREALKHEAASRGVRLVVIDAPLLFEAGVDAECDEVWFIDSPRDQRLARVSATRGWDEAELSRRESAQIPLEEKRRRATRVIANDGSIESLRARVREAAALARPRDTVPDARPAQLA